jgi:hypothetical protein
MKLVAMLVTLCIIIVPAAAFSLPGIPSLFRPAPAGGDLVPVASFEGGQRYLAGDYPVIVLSGSYRQMGRQYGGLMKDELAGEYAFILSSLRKRGYSQEEVRSMGREAAFLYPQRLQEVFTGMAETSGLAPDDILVVYNGALLYLGLPTVQPSCSYLAAWGNYTTDGSVVVSRNWDLADVMLPFDDWNVLALYRPSDGSNGVATFGPAGMRPETLMNSKGLFISDDNAGFLELAPDTRPDLVSEFFRFMLDYSDLKGLDAGLRGARTNAAWIVDAAGPEGAYVYEVMTNDTRQRTGDGVVAAANHFADPGWNLSAPAEHSLIRYNNLLRQAGEAKGSIDAQKMMQIRNVRWEDSGATFGHSVLESDHPDMLFSTLHQVVFVPKTRTLWIRTPDGDWQKVELAPLFGA